MITMQILAHFTHILVKEEHTLSGIFFFFLSIKKKKKKPMQLKEVGPWLVEDRIQYGTCHWDAGNTDTI